MKFTPHLGLGAVSAFFFSSLAHAQVPTAGTLTYSAERVAAAAAAAEPAVAVPLGGGVFLTILGFLLLSQGKRALARKNTFLSLMLAMAGLATTFSGGGYLQQAYAVAMETPLANPAGDTVDILETYQEFPNTSGVILKIDDISIEDCDEGETRSESEAVSELPACAIGMTLGEGQGCYTDVAPCESDDGPVGERITFREGYYWVRADYRAPRADHGTVCAEFGLVATERYVPLTWDAALLAQLAGDFGYESNGDDNDSATSMWCWDGDGGPDTPTGYCSTHNFGASYDNYGYWGSDTDIRPVFTCMEGEI